MDKHTARLEDEILILQYRAGEMTAFEKLVTRWQSRIRWFIVNLIQDEAISWDISQEVWIGAFKSLKSGKRIENFSAWIYGVARNKAISHLRKTKQFQEEDSIDLQSLDEASVIVNSSDKELELVENTQLLQECLQHLPLNQREILSFFYLKDLSLKEIVAMTKTPLGTIQSRLHYGRNRLKEILVSKGYKHD